MGQSIHPVVLQSLTLAAACATLGLVGRPYVTNADDPPLVVQAPPPAVPAPVECTPSAWVVSGAVVQCSPGAAIALESYDGSRGKDGTAGRTVVATCSCPAPAATTQLGGTR